MRELYFDGVPKVFKIATELNPSDILTKVLSLDAFQRHSSTLLGAARVGASVGLVISDVARGVRGRTVRFA